jgi:hypothetical protein
MESILKVGSYLYNRDLIRYINLNASCLNFVRFEVLTAAIKKITFENGGSTVP